MVSSIVNDYNFPLGFKTLFKTEGVTDIIYNGTDFMYEKNGELNPLPKSIEIGSIESWIAFVNQIVTRSKRSLNKNTPILSGTIKELNNMRYEFLIPPTIREELQFSFRIPSKETFKLDDFFKDEDHKDSFLKILSQSEKNRILISGSTGSGKTSFMKTLLNYQESQSEELKRHITIEDTIEIGMINPLSSSFIATEQFDSDQMLKSALRMRPDVINVGEIRDKIGYTLLKAWNTGHDEGMATIHANSCLDAITRLKLLATEHQHASVQYMNASVDVISLVVQVDRNGKKREVSDFLRVQTIN